MANRSAPLNSNLDALPGSENRMKKFLPVPEILGGASEAPFGTNVTIFGPAVEG